MTKKSILIIEDETIISADLQARMIDMGYEVFAAVDSGEAAIRAVRNRTPDLILMDVHLSGALDGIETAKRLKKIIKSPLIFLTSNSDDPTFRRACSVQPQAFLSKPYRTRDLEHAITLAINQSAPGTPAPGTKRKEASSAHNDRLFIKVKDRLVRLMFSDILYLEADDYYCKVHTEDHSYLATKTLKKLCAQFPPKLAFFRCHRSYVVNLNRVTEIGDGYVYLGKHKVPISRSKRAEILALVNNM
ncbi:response regulator transcription factor [Neolewinella aurantiaca]|uniref:Response regulator transcription factor n=1 Tax=Neolewinella aurantiaca TaxID=2602767 RepID=A0A5C7F9R7_9BACT|nr:LytTR family transcriptional regulator DNA-binding domain-containing protein [Neolewinella aurantiaca]TXF86300.1 response regulator transcription factor [Neolewinella aurantiaca]